MPRRLPLLACALLSACANDLRDDFPFDGQVNTGPLVTATRDGEVTHLSVDATNRQSQVFIDLDEGRELKAEEAFETNAWDLAVKRYEIAINSGASNPEGAVELVVLTGTSFDGLTQAPATGYAVDVNEHLFSTVHEGWYLYDIGVHRLTARPLVYVVKTSSGAYLKVQMLGYYDAAGTPAVITLRYAPLTPP